MPEKHLIVKFCVLALLLQFIVLQAFVFNTPKTYTTEQLYTEKSNAIMEIITLSPRPEDGIAGGTGFFISDDGYFVTAGHVVYDKDAGLRTFILLTSDEKQFYTARIVKVDLEHDIAVLKVDKILTAKPENYNRLKFNEGSTPTKKFPFLKVKYDEPIRAGAKVITIGYPGIFYRIVTEGIISSSIVQNIPIKNEHIVFKGVITTSLFIYPGNSGGPVFDMQGNVIGVATLANEKAPMAFFQKAEYIEKLLNDKSSVQIISEQVPYDE